ncbi:methyltransferase domain-containing protein [Candidatus Micrarchaeota archaeon]|nr:methyltransferase domain-containing protein [Candidatus Micrarchaeota archaeon]
MKNNIFRSFLKRTIHNVRSENDLPYKDYRSFQEYSEKFKNNFGFPLEIIFSQFKPGSVWVDACCGEGIALKEGCKKFGLGGIGIDFNADNMKFRDFELRWGNIDVCTIPKADIITCFFGLNFVETPVEDIIKMYDALNDEGILIFTSFNIFVRGIKTNILNCKEIAEHIQKHEFDYYTKYKKTRGKPICLLVKKGPLEINMENKTSRRIAYEPVYSYNIRFLPDELVFFEIEK